MNLEKIDLLHPMLQSPALRLIEQAKLRLSIDLAVIHTYRSSFEQLKIFQEGRSMINGNWVVVDQTKVKTKAMPGKSAHNVITKGDGKPAAMAIDLMYVQMGKIVWIEQESFWMPIYDLAWKCGLDPLGDTIGASLPGDWGHFEEPAWKMKLEGLGLLLPTSDITTI